MNVSVSKLYLEATHYKLKSWIVEGLFASPPLVEEAVDVLLSVAARGVEVVHAGARLLRRVVVAVLTGAAEEAVEILFVVLLILLAAVSVAVTEEVLGVATVVIVATR